MAELHAFKHTPLLARSGARPVVNVVGKDKSAVKNDGDAFEAVSLDPTHEVESFVGKQKCVAFCQAEERCVENAAVLYSSCQRVIIWDCTSLFEVDNFARGHTGKGKE
jgi:hypothetical protein